MDLRHHTAQPSLSRQLRELELEFDARLLESRARLSYPTRGTSPPTMELYLFEGGSPGGGPFGGHQ
jgi:hypothetical protein